VVRSINGADPPPHRAENFPAGSVYVRTNKSQSIVGFNLNQQR
jgi:hypothetical protein